MRRAIRLLCQLTVLAAASPGIAFAQTPVYAYQVIKQYPHDPSAFTEGLELADGTLYESTGLYGSSDLRQVSVSTGAVLRRVAVDAQYFAEGMTLFQGKIFQLTYQSQTALVYDKATFARIGTFFYPGEGWGLTHDDTHLIMSDGTSQIRFLDPATFQTVRTITVRNDQGSPIGNINELEYINGDIYANIWPTTTVARISATTGQLLGVIDFSALVPGGNIDVLNGIAYDKATGHLLVTGKWWPVLYEVRVLDNSAPVASNQSVTTQEDTPRTIVLSATDANGDRLTYTVASAPAHGTLSGTAPPLVYTPAANYFGSDSFTFTAHDGTASSNTATVSIVVAAVNDAPTASNESYATAVNTPISIGAPGVLSNDRDVENSPLTAVLVGGPSHGSLVLNANGSFTYTPVSGFVGSDAFTYAAHDGGSTSNTATVSITVAAPAMTISPTSISFGNQTVGVSSPAKIVTLTNNGGTSVAITSITLSGGDAGDFVQTNTCGGFVAARSSCSIAVSFRPAKAGAKKASLVVKPAAGSTSLTVALTGSGKKR